MKEGEVGVGGMVGEVGVGGMEGGNTCTYMLYT